jgi:GR25 family glycosyltransferase involved in LPS biosynthesis
MSFETIIISLDKATERREYLKSKLDGILDYSFFWAIDGQKFRLKHDLINAPAIATFLTHVTLWLEIRNKPNQNYLILEDDIDLVGDISKLESKISTLPDNWDIALFGWYHTRTFGKKRVVNDDWVTVPKFWGMHSYIINKDSITKIYNNLINMDNHIDIQLARLIGIGKINGYFLKEPMFVQSGKFPSQINIK